MLVNLYIIKLLIILFFLLYKVVYNVFEVVKLLVLFDNKYCINWLVFLFVILILFIWLILNRLILYWIVLCFFLIFENWIGIVYFLNFIIFVFLLI